MKTKIICTIGPATENFNTIKQLILAGMSVARINFSHGNHKNILSQIKTIRRVSKLLKKPITILGDLQGPKIRIGYFKHKSILLKVNQKFVITTRQIIGNENIVSTDFLTLNKHLLSKDKIFLDDGKIELEVIKIKDTEIICKVIIGGPLSARKGLSVALKKLPLPGITERDLEDIKFVSKSDFDWVAHSFVRNAEHIVELKNLLKTYSKNKKIKVIAKIEDMEGFENIDAIISVSDGIMVARGDLGVSIDRALVPILQKQIIKKCNKAKKTDIVATQMLDSMINNPYPTRAEVNDVATAIMQGADYVMLSAETSIGKYPIKTVKEMNHIIKVIEKYC